MRGVRQLGKFWLGLLAGSVVALSATALFSAAANAEADKVESSGGSVATLGWPSTTKSAQVRGSARVYAEAFGAGGRLGDIGNGTRIAVEEVVPSKDNCKAWLRIAPRGWVCAKGLVASDKLPTAEASAQELHDDSLGTFAAVRRGGADSFRSSAAVSSGTVDQRLTGGVFVKVKSSTTVGAVRYDRTDQGYIARSALRRTSPSEFVGIDLVNSPPPHWPIAWVSPHEKAQPLLVRSKPHAKGAIVEELLPQAVVPVLAQQDGYIQVGKDQWLDARDARIAQTTTPPLGVRADEQWIDVDLDQQVLIAYVGKKPVYATMVSTAKRKFITPLGVWRLRDKDLQRRMRNTEGSTVRWNVAAVPFVMGFRKMYAIHGAYWHNGFGRPRSHGCVNLSPADAAVIFAWSQPRLPPGWTSVEYQDGQGTPLRIRNSANATPNWRGYNGEILGPSI